LVSPHFQRRRCPKRERGKERKRDVHRDVGGGGGGERGGAYYVEAKSTQKGRKKEKGKVLVCPTPHIDDIIMI